VLDQVGLHQALAQAAESLGVTVHHEPGRHGPLPAAIELAAYRIAVEALTNVARHSGVGAARLSLRETGRCLVVGVADGGAGLAHDAVPGVGLTVMRERAEEVGGTLSVRPAEGGGTAVTAVLPLGAPARTRAEAIR
jgi:signal transduction histidine kinase